MHRIISKPFRMVPVLCALLIPAQPVHSFRVPSIFQCKAVLVTQTDANGRPHSRGFQLMHLFVRFDHSEIQVFGTQSEKDICRKFPVRNYYADTVFLMENPDLPYDQSDLKLYLSNDTLIGNVNLFESGGGSINARVLVKPVYPDKAPDFTRMCR